MGVAGGTTALLARPPNEVQFTTVAGAAESWALVVRSYRDTASAHPDGPRTVSIVRYGKSIGRGSHEALSQLP